MSAPTVVQLPVPRMPKVCQSSSTVSSLIGTTQSLSSGPFGPASRATRTSQWACRHPVLYGHRPDSQ